jgi:hypothetical protein
LEDRVLAGSWRCKVAPVAHRKLRVRARVPADHSEAMSSSISMAMLM